MADWPNGGQLPLPTEPSFFDAGMGMPPTQEALDSHNQQEQHHSQQPNDDVGFHQNQQDPLPERHFLSNAQQQTLDPSNLSLDAFFLSNGGWRPPEPCNYCRRMRLHCFMIQTTEVNPNPVTSCSSCVALFRQCSLAERNKRHHSAFETSAPVIGQLHGVSEEDAVLPGQNTMISFDQQFPFGETSQGLGSQQTVAQPASAGNDDGDGDDDDEFFVQPPQEAGLPRFSAKRTSARMVKRTRALRNWFSRHQERPYPSDDDKALLAAESGLTRTQVTNWFTNARRRQRQSMRAVAKQSYFPQGSPMAQRSPSEMSPLERWRNSPPEDDAVCAAALHNALDGLNDEVSDSGNDMFRVDFQAHAGRDFSSGSISQSSSYKGNDLAWLDLEASSNSDSSAYSYTSDNMFGLISPAEEYSPGELNKNSTALPTVSTGTHLFCTFCQRSFKKKSDWVRHERTIHLPDLDSWVCSLSTDSERSHLTWCADRAYPSCAYCGHENPTPDHLRTHEFEACAERSVQERSFTRKDHLWQHLQKFHGCKRWEGWSLELNSLQNSNDAVRSRCGFCGLVMDSWKARAGHIAAHFRSGLTLDSWRGDAGVEGLSPATK